MLMAEPSPGRGRRFEAPYETSGGETFTRDAHGVYLTVDGRNPAPVDMVNIPLFTGLFTLHPRWCISFNSITASRKKVYCIDLLLKNST